MVQRLFRKSILVNNKIILHVRGKFPTFTKVNASHVKNKNIKTHRKHIKFIS